MAQVKWTPQAADDLEAICLFIARDSAQVAAIFADRVLRATVQLENFLRLGRVVPELGIENVREIFVGNYRVIYRIHRGEAHVLTIHHGAQLLETTKIDAGT